MTLPEGGAEATSGRSRSLNDHQVGGGGRKRSQGLKVKVSRYYWAQIHSDPLIKDPQVRVTFYHGRMIVGAQFFYFIFFLFSILFFSIFYFSILFSLFSFLLNMELLFKGIPQYRMAKFWSIS